MPRNYDLKLKGYVGDWDFDPDYVDWFLSSRKGQNVSIVIDSLGGSLFSGISVANSFALHGNVTVHYVGYNASAATVASLGAKRITMDSNGMYLVHKSSQFVCKVGSCNADQIKSLIESLDKDKAELEKVDLNIASMYASRCKKSKEDLLALMAEGGWITAQEALEWGFIDAIEETKDSLPALSEEITASLLEHDIPVPPAAEKSAGAFKRVLNAVDSFFNPKTEMKKVFLKFICPILALSELELKDGKVFLSEEQLNSIENKLKDDASEIEKLKADLDAKEKEIAALKAAPAEKSKEVINNGQSKDNDKQKSLKEIFDNAKEIFKSI